MSDWFYSLARFAAMPAFWVSSRPVVTGLSYIPRSGPCIIAATHQSPYDVPLLIRHAPRHVDFLSIVEVFRLPFVGWLYTNLNAFPLDRSKADPATVRVALDRLAKGRVVAMFPEGGFRLRERSVIHGGGIRPGIARMATLAHAPIIPCVVLNSLLYARFHSWLPLRRTRYALAFGPPIHPDPADTTGARTESRLITDLRQLHTQLLRETNLIDLNAPNVGQHEA